jgi:hypothetical protein
MDARPWICGICLAVAWTASADVTGTACEARADVPYAPRAFLGYLCREPGCDAHKAGFAWADRHGYADSRACLEAEDAGFVEGCRAFAEEAVTAEQAGFEWARENEVSETCLCAGAGPRFEAGCEAYVAGFGH